MALEVIENGGASRDRTDDLIVANDALSQLSYSPVQVGSITPLFYQPSRIRTKPLALQARFRTSQITLTKPANMRLTSNRARPLGKSSSSNNRILRLYGASVLFLRSRSASTR